MGQGRLPRVGVCRLRRGSPAGPPRLRAALAAALVVVLAGCGGTALRWEPRTHVVRAGDTLHAIAFRYGIDDRELAVWNGIDNPDVIFPGQRLRLSAPPGYRPSRRGQGDSIGRDVTDTDGQASPRGGSVIVVPPVGGWTWPAEGPVVRRFGDSTSLGRGLDLSGNQGDPVVASASGKVVYSGSGLLGYGKLIILKHNDTYLSAYGHNETLLVQEGQDVQAGQRIATMGLRSGDGALLHFEIRREGKPVDPMTLLPPR